MKQARADIIRLDQYLKESVSKLQFSWRPVCLKREYDEMYALKNTKCPHDSLLECEIVREDPRKFEGFFKFPY
jgi:nitrite reductase/ring-hydroxylating ferredoxin subunit